MQVTREGDVSMRFWFHLQRSCFMDFHDYPHDKHRCCLKTQMRKDERNVIFYDPKDQDKKWMVADNAWIPAWWKIAMDFKIVCNMDFYHLLFSNFSNQRMFGKGKSNEIGIYFSVLLMLENRECNHKALSPKSFGLK